ncbi:peptidoglycan glycosyltransferase FtsW [Corynebacterium pacaense]|uniref:peptidoglycan glycosyltransferase FtsW n=1 Tax=Corynebacterium pacaense TaxID=1816684 RepID=UPI0009B9B0AE|nr:putative peptidoglycan glycosyltransferase FtsW [Corynebacterium pacaense]
MTSSRVPPRTEPVRSATGLRLRDRIVGAWRDVLSRPLTDYIMILFTVIALTSIGVVMVYSSSMTWSIWEGGSVWGTALRQAVMIVVGLAAMWVCLMVRPQTIRTFAPALLIISIVLLIAVQIPGIGTGREEVGSQSWIVLGPLQFQPSEIAKVAIAVWGAHYLAGRGPATHWLNNHYMRFAAVAGVMTLMISMEGDAGMAVSFLIVVLFMLFFAGIAMGWIVVAGIAVLLGMAALALGGGFRSNRFSVYFDALLGNFTDTRGTAFQSYQGFLSLADGSATGVGLGQSRAKWFYLPEAKNDFIFAIIGEELGLLGGALVIALFAVLLFFGLRTALRSHDPFLSLMAATLTAAVVSQAFINIGYVVGLLPVTGIQLPMISAGGTSAIITLASMGLLANAARHEPEAVSAMASYGRPTIDRLLMLREPTSELTSRNAPVDKPARNDNPGRDRAAASRERFGEPVTARRPTREASKDPSGTTGSLRNRPSPQRSREPGYPRRAPDDRDNRYRR